MTFIQSIYLAQESHKVAHVCPGDQLNLTCNTSGNYLTWDISVPGFQSQSHTLLNGSSQTNNMHMLTVPMSTFMFNISTIHNGTATLPLSSVILSENVPTDLNGTTITCSEIINKTTTIITTTVIHITGNEVIQSKFENCYGYSYSYS